jgi:hypothetical protein
MTAKTPIHTLFERAENVGVGRLKQMKIQRG